MLFFLHLSVLYDINTLLKKIKGTFFNQSVASGQLNSLEIDLVS